MNSAWEEIMQKCPTMKELVEAKIAEELLQKQAEINLLKQENQMLQLAIVELSMLFGGMI